MGIVLLGSGEGRRRSPSSSTLCRSIEYTCPGPQTAPPLNWRKPGVLTGSLLRFPLCWGGPGLGPLALRSTPPTAPPHHGLPTKAQLTTVRGGGQGRSDAGAVLLTLPPTAPRGSLRCSEQGQKRQCGGGAGDRCPDRRSCIKNSGCDGGAAFRAVPPARCPSELPGRARPESSQKPEAKANSHTWQADGCPGETGLGQNMTF